MSLDLEGSIEVELLCGDGRVAEIAVRNRRPAGAGRMFIGRRPDEVTAMLPLLFSLCGHAQLVAGLEALEQAGGLIPSPATQAARRLMVAAETVLEHAQGILRDWPALIGEAPDLAAARGLRAALGSLRGALYPTREWARPGGGRLEPDLGDLARRLSEARRLIERAIFAGPTSYELGDLRNWTDWAQTGTTAAARLVRAIEEADAGGLGASPVPALPPLDRGALETVLAADDGAFLAQPVWRGAPHLTHPLARRAHHPLVGAMLLTHGTGVLTLIAARLADLHACLDEAEQLLAEIHDDPGAAEAQPPGDGNGLGMVQAARGLLVHRIELAGGVIGRYQILAPTEWNFHPDGGVSQGLHGLAADGTLEAHARLLVAALDPCVVCSVMVIHKSQGKSPPNVQGYRPLAGSSPTPLVR